MTKHIASPAVLLLLIASIPSNYGYGLHSPEPPRRYGRVSRPQREHQVQGQGRGRGRGKQQKGRASASASASANRQHPDRRSMLEEKANRPRVTGRRYLGPTSSTSNVSSDMVPQRGPGFFNKQYKDESNVSGIPSYLPLSNSNQPNSGKNSVAFMITKHQKRILIEDLRYSRHDVSLMTADQAHAIIERRASKLSTHFDMKTSTTTPSSVLEQLDTQFGQLTNQVLNDDNFGGSLFPSSYDQQVTIPHDFDSYPKDYYPLEDDILFRPSKFSPSSTRRSESSKVDTSSRKRTIVNNSKTDQATTSRTTISNNVRSRTATASRLPKEMTKDYDLPTKNQTPSLTKPSSTSHKQVSMKMEIPAPLEENGSASFQKPQKTAADSPSQKAAMPQNVKATDSKDRQSSSAAAAQEALRKIVASRGANSKTKQPHQHQKQQQLHQVSMKLEIPPLPSVQEEAATNKTRSPPRKIVFKGINKSHKKLVSLEARAPPTASSLTQGPPKIQRVKKTPDIKIYKKSMQEIIKEFASLEEHQDLLDSVEFYEPIIEYRPADMLSGDWVPPEARPLVADQATIAIQINLDTNLLDEEPDESSFFIQHPKETTAKTERSRKEEPLKNEKDKVLSKGLVDQTKTEAPVLKAGSRTPAKEEQQLSDKNPNASDKEASPNLSPMQQRSESTFDLNKGRSWSENDVVNGRSMTSSLKPPRKPAADGLMEEQRDLENKFSTIGQKDEANEGIISQPKISDDGGIAMGTSAKSLASGQADDEMKASPKTRANEHPDAKEAPATANSDVRRRGQTKIYPDASTVQHRTKFVSRENEAKGGIPSYLPPAKGPQPKFSSTQYKKTASVAFMITNQQKRILIEDLRYSRQDVSLMNADQAHKIIRQRISKVENKSSTTNRLQTEYKVPTSPRRQMGPKQLKRSGNGGIDNTWLYQGRQQTRPGGHGNRWNGGRV